MLAGNAMHSGKSDARGGKLLGLSGLYSFLGLWRVDAYTPGPGVGGPRLGSPSFELFLRWPTPSLSASVRARRNKAYKVLAALQAARMEWAFSQGVDLRPRP